MAIGDNSEMKNCTDINSVAGKISALVLGKKDKYEYQASQ